MATHRKDPSNFCSSFLSFLFFLFNFVIIKLLLQSFFIIFATDIIKFNSIKKRNTYC